MERKKSQKRLISIILGIVGIIVIVIMIVGAEIYFRYFGVIASRGETPSLNCAGLTVNGDYCSMVIMNRSNLDIKGNINLVIWSDALPPSNFDVYILTHKQYIGFISPPAGGNIAYYVHKWDLSYLWNSSRGCYYLNKTIRFKAGEYLVISNNYKHFFQGVYGKARYKIKIYLSFIDFLESFLEKKVI